MGYHRKIREAIHRRKKRPIKDKNKSTYSQCIRKVAYVSFRHAQNIAKNIEAERGQKVRIYLCPICEAYHLTKQSVKIRSTNK